MPELFRYDSINSSVFINSRTAISGAIIGLLLVFYNSKNLNCIGVVFLRLEEEYWRSPFLINFIGVIFEAGNEKREKIWRGFAT